MKFRAYVLAATLLLFQPAAEAKALVFCAAAGPEGFDPAAFAAGATFDATRPIYNRLVQYEPGTNRLIPALSVSFEMSADGLAYSFHLRPGVKFHTTASFAPSRNLNAADVVFSFLRQRKKNPYFDYLGGIWPFHDGLGFAELVRSVEAIDDLTVRFELSKPDAGFPALLTMDFASIVSKEFADKLIAGGRRDALNLEPVGTGPFQLVARQADGTIRYKENPAYWGGKRWIDELVFVVEPDAARRLDRLKAKECRAMAAPSAGAIDAIKADPALALVRMEGNNIGYLATNTLKKPFDDPRVRKAVGLAIDKQAIVEAVFEGAGAVAAGLVPPNLRSAGSITAESRHDPDQAGRLLQEAGVKDLTLKVAASRTARPYDPDGMRTADLIKADLAKVGIAVEVVSYDRGEFIRRSIGRDRDGAVLYGWEGFNGDPEGFLSPMLACDKVGGANRANWCNREFDALIERSRNATIPGERDSLIQQAEAMIAADQPVVPLARSVVSYVTTSDVRDLRIDVTGRPIFDRVEMKD